jgi:hypothetical protein
MQTGLSPRAIAVDSAGDTYVAGYYSSSVTFGSTTLTSPGGNAACVAKLDPSGNWLWATSLGANATVGYADIGLALDTAASNVYVTGAFGGTASFGSFTFISAGSNDVFLSQLSTSTGSVGWALQIGGTGNDSGFAVAVDGSNNVYVSGCFQNTVSFGATQLTASPSGNLNAFLTKITNQSFDWAVQVTGSNNPIGVSLAVDSAGTAFMGVSAGFSNAGSVSSYTSSGSLNWTQGVAGEPSTLALYTDGGGNEFLYTSGPGFTGVAKLSAANGASVWNKNFTMPPGFGLSGNEDIYGVAADSGGNVYATGENLGNGGLGQFDPGSGTAYLDAPRFLAKLDPNGNFLAARITGGEAVAVDPSGNIHSIGADGPAIFGPYNVFDTGDQDANASGVGFVVALTTQDEGGILGRVFDDLNDTGTLVPGENGVSPVTINSSNGTSTTVVPNTFAANGSFFGEYDLNHLAPGTYTISQLLPTGWTQTSGPGTITITAGQYVDTQNFGAFFPNQTKTYDSTNVPISIPVGPAHGTKTVTSTLAVADSYPMLNLQVSITASGAPTASYKLTAPDGTGYPVTPNTTTAISNGQLFQHNVHGTWTLSITNGYGDPGGTLSSWSISVVGQDVPQIGSLSGSPNPVNTGASLTLTAGNVSDLYPGGTVNQVAFYLSTNGTNTLLGYGTQTGSNWSLVTTAPSTAGTYTYVAVAQDNIGAQSEPATATVTVQTKKRTLQTLGSSTPSPSSLAAAVFSSTGIGPNTKPTVWTDGSSGLSAVGSVSSLLAGPPDAAVAPSGGSSLSSSKPTTVGIARLAQAAKAHTDLIDLAFEDPSWLTTLA